MGYSIVDEMRLHRQANRLDSLASQCEWVIGQIQSGGDLSSWDSPAGDTWNSKKTTALSELTQAATEMRVIASRIRSFTASHRYLLEETLEKLGAAVD